jgi:N-acetylglucosamine-6-phosphate deacetylase
VSGFVVTGARLVTADVDLSDAWVEVAEEHVVAVGQGPAPAPPGAQHIDARDRLVVPGLVDIHQHGGGGGSYADGAAAARTAIDFHRGRGTTTSLASLVSAPVDALVDQVSELVPLVELGLLAGIHLEGPWLSPRRRGAHPAAMLDVPRSPDVERLLSAGAGHVRMVTLAPELPGALEAVSQLTEAGVLVAIGHTDATFEQAQEALRRGARLGTHLFNAMRPLTHREPGPVLALLESTAAVELVADGVHLHPRVVADVMRVVGRSRAVLVTDATAAAGMPDGAYRLGARSVNVAGGVATGAEGQIAGSTICLADALRHAVTVAGVPLRAAVAAATRAPARLVGLEGHGELVAGAVADLLVMTPDLLVSAVSSRGRWRG